MTRLPPEASSDEVVCDACGWARPSDGLFMHRCEPEDGKVATELEGILILYNVDTTRFGYGHHKITAFPSPCEPDTLHASFRIDEDGVRVDKIAVKDKLSTIEAAELVRAIGEWRSLVLARRYLDRMIAEANAAKEKERGSTP